MTEEDEAAFDEFLAAALVTATAAVAVPVTMSLTSSPAVSVAATSTPEATDILPATATPEPVTTPFVVEGVSVGYLPQGCDTPGACGVWVGVYKDGATTLAQDGRLDGKKVAENTYLNDGNMIARVLDDTHGVLVVVEPSLAEKLDAATIEAASRSPKGSPWRTSAPRRTVWPTG